MMDAGDGIDAIEAGGDNYTIDAVDVVVGNDFHRECECC